MKINCDISKYKYSAVEKEKIFTTDANYEVALKVGDFWQNGNSVIVETTLSSVQKAYLKITLYEDNIINFNFFQKEIKKNRYFDKTFDGFKQLKIPFKLDVEHIEIKLENGFILQIIKKHFCIKIINKNAETVWQTSLRNGFEHLEWFSTPPLGFRTTDKGKLPFLSLQLDSQELIYGLGEKFSNFVKNGTQSVIYNVDNGACSNSDLAYAGVPLVYSTNNWGMLVNTGHKTEWEIGSPTVEALSVMSHEENLDIVIFLGDSIKELIEKYTHLTGRTKGVPDKAYGIWLNRLYYHNREELFTEIKNSQKHKYPIDVFTLDPKWMKNRFTKTCNFQFNDEAFGDFKKLMSDVKSEGFDMCFWINPYLQIDNSDTWKEAFENNYYIKKADGSIAHIWSGLSYYQETASAVDLTNPEAVVWWKEKIKQLFANGVGFIKPDYGDSIDEDALLYNGETGKDFRNSYIELYIKYSYEAMEEYFGEKNAFVLSRPGYIGTQKYPGKWAGDSATSFNELKMQLNSGLSNSLCGTVVWGTDIGGFASLEFVDHKDLYARWTQFGMITPFSRYHGFGAREPWYFSKEELAISKKFATLKRKLLPNYKVWELEAIKTGLPILRPLVLEFQNDAIAQKIDDQFMIGENLMMAPILKDKTYSRQVYFPAGKWKNIFTKKEYEGNKTYEIECPIDEALVFIKHESVLVTIKQDEFSFSKLNEIDLEIWSYGKPKQKNIEFYLDNKLIKLNLDKLDNRIEIKEL